jgi:hypothetical protein
MMLSHSTLEVLLLFPKCSVCGCHLTVLSAVEFDPARPQRVRHIECTPPRDGVKRV